MTSERVSLNSSSGLGSLQESDAGNGVCKKRSAANSLSEIYASEPEVKKLTKRAVDGLKQAFSEGLKKLSLKPVYGWSAEHNITPSKINKLLNLHGLIKAAAKSSNRFIPIQNRKVTDPGFLNFIREAEKQVIKSNPHIKVILKEQKKKHKVTRGGRKRKRKVELSDSEYTAKTAALTEESTFESVDRKADKTSGLDSTRANKEVGPADVQKSKG